MRGSAGGPGGKGTRFLEATLRHTSAANSEKPNMSTARDILYLGRGVLVDNEGTKLHYKGFHQPVA